MQEFKSERWDVNHIINDDHDLIGLLLLWRGRANDIDEQLSRYEFSHAEERYLQGQQETFRRLADDLELSLKVVGYETKFKKASDLSKGFLDE